jgi:hypothetical protein
LEPAHGLKSQAGNLVCYFANLSKDLERWLIHGTVALSEILYSLNQPDDFILAIVDSTTAANVFITSGSRLAESLIVE